jgi:hypothetical protein
MFSLTGSAAYSVLRSLTCIWSCTAQALPHLQHHDRCGPSRTTSPACTRPACCSCSWAHPMREVKKSFCPDSAEEAQVIIQRAQAAVCFVVHGVPRCRVASLTSGRLLRCLKPATAKDGQPLAAARVHSCWCCRFSEAPSLTGGGRPVKVTVKPGTQGGSELRSQTS